MIIASTGPTDRRAAGSALRSAVELKFIDDKNYQTEGVLLHEMAHLVTNSNLEGHGPEYAKNHLAIVREFRGEAEANKIRENYTKFKVCLLYTSDAADE